MWLLLIALATDSATLARIAVAPAETLTVTSLGEGPAVVLVPGLFGSNFGFRHVLPRLTAMGYRAVVIEPLAVGTSSRPRRADYSLAAQAIRLARVLDTLGLRKAIVVAHSLGAGMALRLAWRRPDLVGGLVLLEGGPAETAASPGFRRALEYAPWVKWAGGLGAVQRIIRQGLKESSGNPGWVDREVIAQYTAGAARDLDATLLAYLAIAESREPTRLGPHLGEIVCPVRLLLGGARHKGGPEPEQVRRLRQKVLRVSVDTVPGAGHYLHEEQPEVVVQAIEAVMRELRPVG
ncbi:MAG TPA: alpha/beta hydrolase [Gemmatimonadales bacterium]|jgi:pimeloyl-ACP methyl ester carboxylesterase